jgi:hypothetical protein
MKSVDTAGSDNTETEELIYTMSCNIYRDPSMTRILLGVRRGTPASRRHPGVLSTPTMRLPRSLFESVAGPYSVANCENGIVVELENQRSIVTGPDSFQYSEAFLVESLMARKLGLADSLMMGLIRAHIQTVIITVDDVPDPLGTGISERTLMISYSVILSRGADQIPRATSSYSRLIWAETKLLGKALKSKDALIVDESLDPFEVCIDGLCVRSAVYQIDRMANHETT